MRTRTFLFCLLPLCKPNFAALDQEETEEDNHTEHVGVIQHWFSDQKKKQGREGRLNRCGR